MPWNELEKVTAAQRCEELRSVAAINLKKIPGGHTTNRDRWWQTVIRDQEYIREQFILYNADLVVCCGSHINKAFKFIDTRGAGDWQHTSRGVEYLEYPKQKFVVAYSHPEARVASNLIHYGLVDALHEIFRVSS